MLALKRSQSWVIRFEDILSERVYSGRLVDKFDLLVELNENMQEPESLEVVKDL